MSQQSYHLLDSEREYLQKGTAPGGYRPRGMEKRLTEKVELLPARFERLFADIEQLEQGSERTANFFATEAGRYAWAELMGLEENSTREERKQALSFYHGEPGPAAAEFGAKLGRTVNSLAYWPAFGDHHQDDVVADLVWGFFRGLHYDPRTAGSVTDDVVRKETTAILDRVEDRADTHAEQIRSPATLLEDSHQRQAKKREMAIRVHEILGKDQAAVSLEMDWGFAEWIDERESGPSEFCSLVVAHLIDDAVDEEHEFDSVGQDRAFWREHGPGEEFAVEDFVTEVKVHSVVESRQLFEKYDLLCQLERDAKQLADKGWKGAATKEVLPQIVEEGPISSTDIARDIYESRDYAASVTRLAKDLAGIDCETRDEEFDVWTDRPLLEGDRNGWEATRYGRATNHALQRYLALQEVYAQPIQFTPLPDELIEAALNEI